MTNTSLISRLQAWLPLAPLLLLLGGTYWLDLQVQPLPLSPDDSQRHDPDFLVENFFAVTYNRLGAPRFLVDARKMEHFPDDDSTLLEKPHLFALYKGAPPVAISSNSGEISKNGDAIVLRNAVRIVRDADGGRGELVINTNYLHVVPDMGVADTDRPITMQDEHNFISATGMKFDYRAREIKLLAQVKGRYDPAKN